MRGQCQICGRLQRVAADGAIAHHHYLGDICLGAYSPPVTDSFDAIPAAIDHWTQVDNRYSRKFEADCERRSNEPLSADFWASWAGAARERARLIGRLKGLASTLTSQTRESEAT